MVEVCAVVRCMYRIIPGPAPEPDEAAEARRRWATGARRQSIATVGWDTTLFAKLPTQTFQQHTSIPLHSIHNSENLPCC